MKDFSLKKVLCIFFVLSSFLFSAILYKDGSYPNPGRGAQNAAWDTALETTLTGYKTRYIDDYGTGLVHDPSRTYMAVSGAVSEGTGYGLLLFIWGNQYTNFDALWSAAAVLQQNPDKLFAWINRTNGEKASATAATDADQDIALALIFADSLKRNGYSGWKDSVIDYGNEAQEIINSIYEQEISNNYVYPDDLNWINPDFNPSYFSPASYRVIAQFDNASTHNWKGVIDQGYTILDANPGAPNGLAPDWCNFDGTVPSNVSRGSGPSGSGSDFWYDAIRVPLRLGMDYVWYGEPRAQSFLNNAMSWIAANTAIMYQLDKTAYGGGDGAYHNELTVGMWGAGAMGSSDSAKQTQFLTEMGSYYTGPNDYFGANASAKPYYFNQSMAWIGTGLMNGAVVDVFADLSVTASISEALVNTFNVGQQNVFQVVVTDNDGWNNINGVTVSFTDKNSKVIDFVYKNDWGSYSFYSNNSGLLTENNLSYNGNNDVLTLDINCFIAITQNFFPGTIDIALKIEDFQNNILTISTENTYNNQSPSVNYTIYSNDSILPTVNSYQDSLTIRTTYWNDDDRQDQFVWSLGDGFVLTTNSTADVNYAYSVNTTGNITLNLVVYDYFNENSSYSQRLWINPLPIASINISAITANLVDSLTFDLTNSTDDMSLKWITLYFGDGSNIINTTNYVQTKQYSAGGTKNVCLVVYDNYDGSTEVSTDIYINYNPSPTFTYSPVVAVPGQTFNLDATTSWDDDHTSIINFGWSFVSLGTSATGITSSVSFANSGSHNVVLRATDNWGAVGIVTKTLYVDYPPTADFQFVTNNIYIPCVVTLDASIATDQDDTIVSYYWDFGDGSTGNGMITPHTYYMPDTQNVILVVADTFGVTDSIMIPIKLFSTVRIGPTYYATIQEAINSACGGDIISINVDQYALPNYQENLSITKSITIRSESLTNRIRLDANNSRGVFISSNAIQVYLEDFEIHSASADMGAGIYVKDSRVWLTNSIIRNSTANYGGGIYLDSAVVSISSSAIYSNAAKNSGGGIYSSRANFQLDNTNVYANRTILGSSNGGGISILNSQLQVNNSTVSENVSVSSGGGFYLSQSNSQFNASTIRGNTATNGFGGGIHQNQGTLNISYCYLGSNQSSLSKGGALSSEAAMLYSFNNLYVSNQALINGGALYINNSYFMELNDTVVYNDAAVGTGLFAENFASVNIHNTLYYQVTKDIYISDDDNISFVTLNNTIANSLVTLPTNKKNTTNFVVGVNPLLNPDYSLSVYSPFIDFGNSSIISSILTVDYNNDPRITNNSVDIGCFETYDSVAPIVPQWTGLTDFVTINTGLTLNGVCSTDVYSLDLAGGVANSINYDLYDTSFYINLITNSLTRNSLAFTVADRAGNSASVLALVITHDQLPAPAATVSYVTSDYTLQAVFDARATDPGSAVGDPLAAIDSFQLQFADGSITKNTSGLFTFVVADMIDQIVTLSVTDNYNLNKVLTININPPTYFIPNTLNLMAFPMTFSGNIYNVIGTANARIWEYDFSISSTYNELSLGNYLELGNGYWIYAPNGAQMATITRSYYPLDSSYSITLNAGWNIFGSPVIRNVDWTQTLVRDGSTVYTQASAFSNGLIHNSQVWGYDKSNTSATYYPYYLTSNIKVWRGYWIYAQKDLELIITPSSHVILQAVENSVIDSKEPLFEVNVVADGYRTKLIAGKADKTQVWYDPRVDIMAPPNYPDQKVKAYFENTNMALVNNFCPESNLQWKLVVQNLANTEVTVSVLALTDTEYELKTEDGQVITSEDIVITASERVFILKAIYPQSTGAVSNFKIYPNPFKPESNNPAEQRIGFEYKLGSASDIKLLIYNLAGRKIQEQSYTSTDTEGQASIPNKIFWNGQDELGQAQGTGMYFYIFMVNGDIYRKGKVVLWN